MKILHVIESMSPRYGGPVSVLTSLSEAQADQGHQVTIATTNIDYPGTLQHVPIDQPVINGQVTNYYFGTTFRPLNISWEMAQKLPAVIAEHDVIDIHGLYRFPPTYAAFSARKQNKPHIIRPHGALDPFLYVRSKNNITLKRLYERFFDFPNIRAADAICFNSALEREQTAFLGFEFSSFVLPNGLDWKLYEHLPGPGGFRTRCKIGAAAPLILFLGRITFKKGLDLLIPAFEKTCQALPGAKLAIVGPDNDGYKAKVQELVTKHHLKDHVIFIDMITGAAVREAFMDADIFVLPSYTENFGMTVIESLACGTPVVISDQVNIYREVENSGGGIITKCDYTAVADAMIELLRDSGRRESMGALGRAWVAETYSWKNIVEKLDIEYQTLITNHKLRAGKKDKITPMHKSATFT